MALFESFVNSEECKTNESFQSFPVWFESFVNSEECKTKRHIAHAVKGFESFVNSEECKTYNADILIKCCLRALLIQKSVKP